jgi:hypothetical protein
VCLILPNTWQKYYSMITIGISLYVLLLISLSIRLSSLWFIITQIERKTTFCTQITEPIKLRDKIVVLA